ncbi:MAG: AMP-binding protein, partial [Candidatus Binatia bacterium]
SVIVNHPLQQAIRAKCFHPSGTFIEFKKEEIEQSIPDRFEQMVRMYPDRLAVKTRDHQLTYDELNKAANRVARTVLNHSGEEPVPVALLFEQDTSLIAALLGAFKSGNFYVPLDPSFPSSRTTFILKDSGVKLILTDRENIPLAHELSQGICRVVNYDDIDPDISDESLGLSISPDQYAWLLYTSGSTGQPKDVVQNHRNVLHFVMNYTNGIHICSDDRLSLLRHISAFGAVRDILGALLNGATILPFDVRNEGIAHLANWLIREGITISFFGSPLFRYFLDNLTGEEEFPALRVIRLGSDSVRKKDVENFTKYFPPHCLLVNGLSSTETGTVRRYFIDKDTEILTSTVPVGYPVEDAEVLLLDEHGDEVDAAQVGEIAVKSRYLALGYWKRPDLTEAAFMEDPEDGTRRIYRMGDLGRMSPDGRLEHLGRKDFQVKIRGYRVEISEVEMALLNLDTIQDTVVLVREDRLGDQRLVAYVVPAVQPSPDVSTLRNALAKSLPEHMIPSAFVVLDSIPLNPNGKVDRKALPVPDSSRPELGTPFVAPRSSPEEELAKIWAEVLGLNQVGVHDNFLELGGNSLLATQVVSRVIKTFPVELPLKSLFELPTVADMAVVIVQNQAKKIGQEDLARMLTELEPLSDEEARQRLADESK